MDRGRMERVLGREGWVEGGSEGNKLAHRHAGGRDRRRARVEETSTQERTDGRTDG